MLRTLLLIILSWMTWQLTAQTSPARVVVEHLTTPSLINEAGEPTTRRATVYLPPGYDDSDRAYPVIYYLHGFTWSDSLNLEVSRLDTLFAGAIEKGLIPPVIIVNPDHPPFYANFPFGYVGDSLVVRGEVLAKWQEHMPVNMAVRYRDNLQRLKALKIEWGRNDEFDLVLTSRRFSEQLEDLGIHHYAEEFLVSHTDQVGLPYGRMTYEMLPFFSYHLEFTSPTKSSDYDGSR